MQMEPAERPLVKLEALRLLHRLGLNPAQVQLISGFIDTYLKLNPAEEAAFQAELANILPTEQEGVMEIVTSWMERGIEQGREQGLEQGREQGIAEVVERLLNRRFGSLSPSLQEAVRRLSVAQLEELAEALLDFENEADLEAWLNQRESQ
jgi:flagellar biosynthesis/type III secretory pathway protein FliH